MATMKASPIKIVAYVEDQDLRQVQWNQTYLEKAKREHRLQHGQAVVFCNVAQTKFRLVCCFFDFSVLMLPPVDHEQRVSLYLKIAAFLRTLGGRVAVMTRIETEIEGAKERLQVQQAKAKAAKKKLQAA